MLSERRRSIAVVIVVFATCLGASLAAALTASTAPPRLTNSGFVTLARHGIDGTFEATYVVRGLPHGRFEAANGTVVVAQKAAPGRTAWPDYLGSWSFLVRLDDGWGFQWVEHGHHSEDCVLEPGSHRWACTGDGRFTPSIGFELSIYPFLPGSAFQSLDVIVTRPMIDQHVFGTFTRSSRHFGTLQCLRVEVERTPSSWCLNHDGFLVSEAGDEEMGYTWPLIHLIRLIYAVSKKAFVPLGKPKSPFVVLPS
jgi:hypothetical protein